MLNYFICDSRLTANDDRGVCSETTLTRLLLPAILHSPPTSGVPGINKLVTQTSVVHSSESWAGTAVTLRPDLHTARDLVRFYATV